MPTAFKRYAHIARTKGQLDLANRLEMEARCVGYLLDECLRRRLLISVHDGEEWCLTRCTDREKIMDALASTDEDVLLIRHPDGPAHTPLGRFFLVYGNTGWDVIADHSDNETCNSIWDAILPKLDAEMAR
jgi:hypothetical protein